MAAPEGYTALGRIGFVDRGTYSASATYQKGDVAFYQGSTWLCLVEGTKGVTPAAGANWKYFARGFNAETATELDIVDKSGILGTAGATVDTQALIDAVVTRVLAKLDASKVIANLTTTVAGSALDATMGKQLADKDSEQATAIAEINSSLVGKINWAIDRDANYAWIGEGAVSGKFYVVFAKNRITVNFPNGESYTVNTTSS
ncbi:MAG: hypothetical protein Q4C60_07765 [Eubacteriales bacterium]|nr:hypothetical protein [Eubacteriales bacterium]